MDSCFSLPSHSFHTPFNSFTCCGAICAQDPVLDQWFTNYTMLSASTGIFYGYVFVVRAWFPSPHSVTLLLGTGLHGAGDVCAQVHMRHGWWQLSVAFGVGGRGCS